jgi:hypothetical protein
VLALADQDREGGSRSGPVEHVAGRGEDVAMAARLAEDLDRELVPRAASAAGHVMDAVVLAVEQSHQARAEVARVRRAADLVTDHDDLVLSIGEPEHRVDEVAPVHAEQPRRAHDEVTRVGGRGLLLAGKLRLPVSRERVRPIGLDVAIPARAVEDVVARRIDHRHVERRGGRGDDPGARPVRGERLLQVRLGAVHVGPGRAVDHRAWVVIDDALLDRRAVEDVQLVVSQSDRLVVDGLGGERHVPAEHAGAACDQDLQ